LLTFIESKDSKLTQSLKNSTKDLKSPVSHESNENSSGNKMKFLQQKDVLIAQ
jgi:hypothetical protein